MDTLTLPRAAARWAGDIPEGSDEPALRDAIFAGAEADRYTGLILGGPEPAAGDGVIMTGQPFYQYENGVCTDRWVTLQAERGTLVWVVMGPGSGLHPTHPEGTFPTIEAAMETAKDRHGRPLDWTQPYPDGIWRAGSPRAGHWIMFASIVQEG